jgi:hypothetical protein
MTAPAPPSKGTGTGTDRLYTDLQRQYDLIADRRKVLTSQATNLMGFAGIINTILIALIIALATNKDVKPLLIMSPYYGSLVVLAGTGFIAYVLAAIFSLLAYWEPKWIPAPQIPEVPGCKDSFDKIKYFWTTPSEYKVEMNAYQFGVAIDCNQRINNTKFDNLKRAYSFLIIGIGVSAIAGVLLLIMTV